MKRHSFWLLPFLLLSSSMMMSCQGEEISQSHLSFTPIADQDPYVLSVRVIQNPRKLQYYVGDSFDPSGLIFIAEWWLEEGEVEEIEMTHTDCDRCSLKGRPLTLDDKEAVFTVGGYDFSIAISVNEKNLSDHTLSLSMGRFADGSTSKIVKEGDALPEIIVDDEAFGGWYYHYDGTYRYFFDEKEFTMPAEDVTLIPLLFQEERSCTPRYAGGGTIPPVYLNDDVKTEAGQYDNSSEGLSEMRVQYQLFPQQAGEKIYGNNGAHVPSGCYMVRWRFHYVSGDALQFNFWLEKDYQPILKTDGIAIDETTPLAEFYTLSDASGMGESKTFIMELNKNLPNGTTFIMECCIAKIEK